MMGAPNIIGDNLDCGLSYSVISYLKKLSQQVRIINLYIQIQKSCDFSRSFSNMSFSSVLKAKMESDRLIVSVGKKAPQETSIKVKNHSNALSLAHRRDFKQLLQGITGEMPFRLADINFKEFAGFQIGLLNKVKCPSKTALTGRCYRLLHK